MEQQLIKSFDAICREQIGANFGSAEALAELWGGPTGDIAKAMASQDLSAISGSSFGDLSTLRVEDLDNVMTSVLWTAEELKLQRWIQRTPARQLYWQYEVQNSYGNERGMAGFVEGGAPEGSVSTFARRQAKVMFLGRKGGLTHQAAMMRQGMMLDPVAKENQDRTLELLSILERQMVFGQASMRSVDGVTINYDGIYYQLLNGIKDPITGSTYLQTPGENLIDLRGKPIDFDTFDNIGYILSEVRFQNDWSKVKAFMTGKTRQTLTRLLRQADRREIGATGDIPRGGVDGGVHTGGYTSPFGYFPFEHTKFLEPCPGRKAVNTALGEPASPFNPPTVPTLAQSAATSKMQAGTYYYFVSSLNADGETSPSAASASITVASSNVNKVTLTLTRATGDTGKIRGYRIYRGTSNVAADARWVADVADPRSGGATFTWDDTNAIIPGTSCMLVLEGSLDNLTIAQLAPLMKMIQPHVDTTFPFLLLLYHTVVVRAPQKAFLVYNIGDE